MHEMKRSERTMLRLCGLATDLLPLIAQKPEEAYAYALHKKVAQMHGEQYASVTDVNRTLHEMANAGILTSETETNTRREKPRVFYKPTFLGGFYLGMMTPRSDWIDIGLAPKPETVRKAS